MHGGQYALLNTLFYVAYAIFEVGPLSPQSLQGTHRVLVSLHGALAAIQ